MHSGDHAEETTKCGYGSSQIRPRREIERLTTAKNGGRLRSTSMILVGYIGKKRYCSVSALCSVPSPELFDLCSVSRRYKRLGWSIFNINIGERLICCLLFLAMSVVLVTHCLLGTVNSREIHRMILWGGVKGIEWDIDSTLWK